MKFELRNPITGLSLTHVSAGHAAGIGYLVADGEGNVTWQAPGADTAGASTALADGDVVIVPAEDTDIYIVVSRDAATDPDGTAIVIVTAGSTTTELLAAVDDAILECLKAQSEGLGDANVSRANLDALRRFRQDLQQEQASSTRGGGIATNNFGGIR